MLDRAAGGAGRFLALDGMRGIACYAVMATHVAFATGLTDPSHRIAPWLARLDTSVPIFLMLSGFLLYRPFVAHAVSGRPAQSVRDFWRRRAVRVLPGYWLATVVTLAWLTQQRPNGGDWLAYLTLTQTYNHHDLDPSLTQMWTLVVEVAFYLCLPLMALSLRVGQRVGQSADGIVRGQFVLFVALFCTGMLWLGIAPDNGTLGPASADWLPGTITWFALGMLLAVLSCLPDTSGSCRRVRSTLSHWAAAPGLCWTLALLLYAFITLPIGGPLQSQLPTSWERVTKNVVEGILVFFMMLPLTLSDGGLIGRLLGSRPARFLGEISFGVYLWHLPMLFVIQRAFHIPLFQGHYWELFLLTAASSTLLGTLSWYFLERPALRRFSRPAPRAGREPTTVSTTAATAKL